MITLYHTKIREGKFTSKPLRDLLSRLEGKGATVFIEPRKVYPGPAAHGYYRGTLVPLLTDHWNEEECGHNEIAPRRYTQKEVHSILCDKFLRTDTYDPATDDYRLFTPSTSVLDKWQFAAFVQRVEGYLVGYWQMELPEGPERDAYTLETMPVPTDTVAKTVAARTL